MSFGEWLACVFLAILGVAGAFSFPREWAHPRYMKGDLPTWWLWGEVLWRAGLRFTPVAVYGCGLMAVALPVLAYSNGDDTSSVALGVIGAALIILLVLCLLIGVGVVLFNMPKFAVPPVRRKDRGLLEESGSSLVRLVRR